MCRRNGEFLGPPPPWIQTDRIRIALSIFVIEVFTVFVPCWQVQKHQNLRQETLESIANWESKKRFGARTETSSDKSSAPPLSPTSTKVGDYSGFDSWKKLPNLESNTSQPNLGGIPDESVLTMAALEHVLDKNPEPLRQFSARRDFSGENIAFLTAVAEWKAALPADFAHSRHGASPDLLRAPFTRALRIYMEFISPRDAEFPINIAWHDLRKLQGVFERPARSTAAASPASSVDAATPFADGPTTYHHHQQQEQPTPTRTSRDSQLAILAPTLTPGDIALTMTPITDAAAASYDHYGGDIPAAFDALVFDAAQASIKYLVLTNTWPKYVRERRGSESSASSSSAAAASSAGGGGAGRSTRTGKSGRSGGASTVGGGSVESKVSFRGALEFLKGVIH